MQQTGRTVWVHAWVCADVLAVLVQANVADTTAVLVQAIQDGADTAAARVVPMAEQGSEAMNKVRVSAPG